MTSHLTLAAAVLAAATMTPMPALAGNHDDARGQERVTICHVPPGNSDAAHPITVALPAWLNGHDEHSGHSDDFIVTDERPCPPVEPPSVLDPEPETTTPEVPTEPEPEPEVPCPPTPDEPDTPETPEPDVPDVPVASEPEAPEVPDVPLPGGVEAPDEPTPPVVIVIQPTPVVVTPAPVEVVEVTEVVEIVETTEFVAADHQYEPLPRDGQTVDELPYTGSSPMLPLAGAVMLGLGAMILRRTRGA